MRVTNVAIHIRWTVVASSLLELKLRGAEKLAYENANISELRVVLEEDGTEIEDDSYFQTAEQDTVFLLLRASEKWLPPGIEALKAGESRVENVQCTFSAQCSPRSVCRDTNLHTRWPHCA